MHPTIKKLSSLYSLAIEAPFVISVSGTNHEFQCIVKGYGAKNGMIVDEDWSKIKPISEELISLGYGFSCFNMFSVEPDYFDDVLKDWGRSSL